MLVILMYAIAIAAMAAVWSLGFKTHALLLAACFVVAVGFMSGVTVALFFAFVIAMFSAYFDKGEVDRR